MKKNIVRVLGIYLLLTLLVTLIMREFSFRHTIFFLIDAIILTATEKLFIVKREYYKNIAYGLVIGCSLFIIRYFAPAVIKVWEVNTYFSFVFAFINLFVMLAALFSKEKLRKAFVFSGGTIICLPIILCWGYFIAEHSWLNVEAVMAALQTNPAEAGSYVKDRIGVLAVALLLVIGAFVWMWGKVSDSLRMKHMSKGIMTGFVLLSLLNTALLVRTHDNFLLSIYEETKSFQSDYDEYERQYKIRQESLGKEIELVSKGEDGIFFLVIGESQNRTRMSAYGYELDTTPWLKTMRDNPNMLIFDNAYSCHVQTVPAITYALTAKNQYNEIPLEKALSLIEVAKAAGFETVWLSNQVKYGSWGTPISVIAEAADQKIWLNSHHGNTLDTDYYDGELINQLDKIKKADKMLIVVHLMGNHISYHSRYPAEFEKFYNEGKRSEYDNSILYNDYVMKSLVDKVKGWPDFKGLVYFSDHGEGVNYGKAHNPDTFIFDMSYIPLYMYLTDDWQQANPEKIQNLHRMRANVFTNDLIFDTMLGIMGIRGNGLNEWQNDLTSAYYNSDSSRFKTLYGRRLISDDDGTGK